MAAAFRASREQQDEAGRAESLQAQRQWLQSRHATCGIPLKGDIDPSKSADATACLTGLYQARVSALKAMTTVPPVSSTGPTFDKTIFPATGTHDAMLAVPAFGRYAVQVKSDQGTAIQVVDRVGGPGIVQGSAGHADGRTDSFLDAGQYKVNLFADPHGSGDSEVSIVPSIELEATPRQLVELKPLDTDLGDHQQRSYWLNISERRDVVIEASGRYLDDLRLWRDGKWMVAAVPGASVADPNGGQPLAVRQLAATLEPGLYKLTAYGGEGQKWANGSEAKPLHIRYGIPALAEAGRTRRTTSATGTDRFLVPATATYFRLDIDQPEQAAISIQPYDAKTPFLGGSNRATIDKSTRDPFAEVSGVQGPAGSMTLVTIEYKPGAPYRLTWFDDRQERTELTVRAGDSGWVALYNSGNDIDELDPTIVVADPHDRVIASTAIKVSKAVSWQRRFNLLDDSNLYLEVTEPVDLSVDGEGAEAEFRIEPLIAQTNYRAQPDEPSGYVWAVDPGFYRLNIRPRDGGKGVLTLSLHAKGSPVPTRPAPRQAAGMMAMKFPIPGFYWIYGNTQANVHSGLRFYKSPVDLSAGAAFEVAAAQSIELPVTVPADGRVSVSSDDGTVLPVSADKSAADLSLTLRRGTHDLAFTLPGPDAHYVSVVFAPATLRGDAPLPQIDAKLLSSLPTFPVLGSGKTLYADLAAQQHATFAVAVGKPALYRLESTGLIETTGTLRTRVLPSLDSETANGIGRNFLIKRYLAQGDYQLTITPAGPSHGNIGVALTETPLVDFGTLTPELTARATLPPSQGGLYTFHIDKPGSYALNTTGLGHDFTMRLEDQDGWPLLPPGGPADIVQDFQTGTYRMVLLPGPVENRAVTLLSRVEAPVERSGHGPFPVVLGTAMTNRWMEPAAGHERTPDVWTLSLQAAAEVTVGLDAGMQATLTGKDNAVLGTAKPGTDWTGTLPAGDYQLAAVSTQPNNRVDYTVTVGTKELIAGERRSVQAPVEIPVSIGSGAPVEINSYGDQDVRARLTDEAGALVVANDDRDNDWNFSLAAALPPGRYKLQIDPVGTPTAATDVAIEQPAETHDAPVTPGKPATIADALVHVVPIDTAALQANSLLIVAADSGQPVGLSLERSVGGAWQTVGGNAGTNPFVGLPVGDKTGALRLRIWSRDHTASPVRYTIAGFDAPTVDEADILGGRRLAPVPELGNRIVALHVARHTPGVLLVDDTWPTLQWSTRANQGTQHGASEQIDAEGQDVWLVDRVSDDPLHVRRPDVTGGPVELTIPATAEGVHVSAPATSNGSAVLWKVTSRGAGQAGVLDAAWNPDLMAVGGPENARVAVTASVSGGGGDVKIWQPEKATRMPDLPVTLTRAVFPLPDEHALSAELTDGSFSGNDAARFALPKGAKTLSLNLPKGTVAVLTQDSKITSVIWAWQARVFEVPTEADGLLLMYSGTGQAAYSIGLRQGTLPALQRHDSAGTLVLDECCAKSIMPVGAVESLTTISNSEDSPVFRGLTALPGSGAHAPSHSFIDFTPGLMSYESGLASTLDNTATAIELTAAAPQVLPIQSVRIAAGPARLVKVHVDAPAVLYTGREDAEGQVPQISPSLFDAGSNYFMLMPEGQPRDLMAVSKSGGTMTLSVLITTPLAEGLGPKRRLAPDETRAFSFTLAQPRTVGAGVRASVDLANCTLVSPDGKQYGDGKLVMQALPAGTSVLLVSVPAGAPPVEIEPALVGTVPPPDGPPDDVKANYLALVNKKTGP